MEQNKNIDDLFKEGLGSYAEVPPPAVWDALEKRLDKKDDRPGFFYRRTVILGLGLLIAIGTALAWYVPRIMSNKGDTPSKPAIASVAVPGASIPAANDDAAVTANKETNTNALTENNTATPVTNPAKTHHKTAGNTTPKLNAHKKAEGNTQAAIANSGVQPINNYASSAGSTLSETPKDNSVNTVVKNDVKKGSKKTSDKTTKNNNKNGDAVAVQKTPQAEAKKKTGVPVKQVTASLPKHVKEVKAKTAKTVVAKNVKTNEKNTAATTTTKPAPENIVKNTTEKGNAVAKTNSQKEKNNNGDATPAPASGNKQNVSGGTPGTASTPAAGGNTATATKPVSAANTSTAVVPAAAPKDAVVTTDVKVESVHATFKSDSGAIAAGKGEGRPAGGVDMSPSYDSSSKLKGLSGRFEYGIKGGVEWGFNSESGRKFIFSPYLQYKAGTKLSLVVAPTIKISNVSSRTLEPQSFYRALDTNAPVAVNTPIIGSPYEMRHYVYTQTYDSIVKINKFGGTYAEFEVPVTVQYIITRKLSVFGGFTMVYSKYSGIKESTSGGNGLRKTYSTPDSLVNVNAPNEPPYVLSQVITYTVPSFSQYTAPLDNTFRFGYTIGFNYMFDKRWMFDFLMEQTPKKANMQQGYDINKPISAPYFRLTLGYKLGNF